MNAAALLTPTLLGENRFTAPPSRTDEKRAFGGLLVGQALAAACATVDGRPCHSIQLLFLNAAATDRAVEIDVVRLRDGRSFSARQVQVRQKDRTLVSALVSFHAGDEGPEHQIGMPDVELPEKLEDQRDARRGKADERGETARTYIAEQLLDMRPFGITVDQRHGVEGRRCFWFRSRERLSDAPTLHQTVIAFASDMGTVHVGVTAHNQLGDGSSLDATSLDHSVWFHRNARADEWLLNVQRATVNTNGRGLTHGVIFNQKGELVASVAQEILARRKHEKSIT